MKRLRILGLIAVVLSCLSAGSWARAGTEAAPAGMEQLTDGFDLSSGVDAAQSDEVPDFITPQILSHVLSLAPRVACQDRIPELHEPGSCIPQECSVECHYKPADREQALVPGPLRASCLTLRSQERVIDWILWCEATCHGEGGELDLERTRCLNGNLRYDQGCPRTEPEIQIGSAASLRSTSCSESSGASTPEDRIAECVLLGFSAAALCANPIPQNVGRTIARVPHVEADACGCEILGQPNIGTVN